MSNLTQSSLQAAIESRQAKVGGIGLGYVGLPLIHAFVSAGFRTLGFDVDQSKVEKLQQGESYISHLPSEWIADCIDNQSFQPTSDMSRLSE
ncbi:MAG: NAD(P)-binding domain-containing protein, partial [Pirellulales bacterium]|nr:NAD(P)-binding domain-containing protein [Pirellulales bacterium]